MEFRVVSLPGHTRCCVGYYLEKKALLLSSETLGVYDGAETIVPSCLVGYSDTIASIEKIEKLNVTARDYTFHDSFFIKFCIRDSRKVRGNREELLDTFKMRFFSNNSNQNRCRVKEGKTKKYISTSAIPNSYNGTMP